MPKTITKILSALSLCLILTGCGPKAQSSKALANLEAGKTYLSELAKKPGIHTLSDGVLYKVVSASKETASPQVKDLVKVHYEGRLIDGTVFDSSYDRGAPATFFLKNVVRAWQIAVPKMHKGDVWEIYVPSEMGYADQEQGAIPANSVLVFKIQLIDVLAT